MCLLDTVNWWSFLVSQDAKRPRHIPGICRIWIQHVLSYAWMATEISGQHQTSPLQGFWASRRWLIAFLCFYTGLFIRNSGDIAVGQLADLCLSHARWDLWWKVIERQRITLRSWIFAAKCVEVLTTTFEFSSAKKSWWPPLHPTRLYYLKTKDCTVRFL